MRMDYNGRISMWLRVNAIVVVLMLLLQTSFGKHNPWYHCPASSCGNIPNISYPFRLTTDPEPCGSKEYELSCENNQTVVLYSQNIEYYVQAINYNNQTIRVLHSKLEKSDISSVYDLYHLYGRYRTYQMRSDHIYIELSQFMTFMSCESAMNLSSHYPQQIEIVAYNCNNNTKKSDSKLGHHRLYLMLGAKYVSEIPDLCRIHQIVRTSSPGILIRNSSNISCSDTHKAMFYGFELYWGPFPLGFDCSKHFYCYPIRYIVRFIQWLTTKTYIVYVLPAIWFLGIVPTHSPLIDNILYLAALIISFLILRAVLGAPCVIAFLIYKWRRRHLSMFPSIEEFLETNNNFLPIRYTYSDIKKMTTNFKDKLGEGGYGSVFKGKLRSGGLVAIKILSKSKSNGQDFINEVSTIGRIHHVNVVRLIGFCIEGTKRALVYDLMSNGSLDKYISSNSKEVIVNSLSYKTMFDISLRVASGIDYLHRGCEMQILHFDIKPHNVLLDDNFVPKISDFGLARLCPLETSIVSMTAARGTLGYIAPELFYKNIGGVSFKADVYSFGKLLMEMASKRKNLNVTTEHSSKIYFPSWVYDQLSEGYNIELEDHVTEEESKLVKKMIIVALWCIQLKPSDRPSMNSVIKMLEGRVESLSIPPKLLLYPPQQNNSTENAENISCTSESSSTLSEVDSTEISLIKNAN